MPDGLSFSGYLQPPSVPPDPTGDDWRGIQGPQGPPGDITTLGAYLGSPPPIGNVAPNTGAFTGLSSTLQSVLATTLRVTPNATNTGTLILTQPASATAPFFVTASAGVQASGGIFLNAGPIQIQRNFTYSGSTSVGNSMFRMYETIGGTAADNQATGINFIQTDDNMLVTNDRTWTHFGIATRMNAASSGARNAFSVGINQTAKTQSFTAGKAPWWTAAQFNATASFNEGGTAGLGNAYGAIWGQTIGVIQNAGATYFGGVIGTEYDLSSAAAHERTRAIQVVLAGTHTTRGTYSDAAMTIGAAVGAQTLRHAFEFGSSLDGYAFGTDSTLFYIEYPHAFVAATDVALGWMADMQQATFSGGLIRSRGFIVGTDGTTHVGAGLLKPVAAGLSIDASGSFGPAVGATVNAAAGGTGWATGGLMRDAYNGVYVAATAPAGVLATATVLVQPSIPSGAPPADPVTVTAFGASDGAGATLTLGAWDETQRGVQIASAANKVGFFGTAPIVKPTGVAVSSAGIHAALVSLGLIAA